MKVYVAGPMAGIQDKNRNAFCYVSDLIAHAGDVTVNPAMLPDGLDPKSYMPICLSMIEGCDVVVLLRGW